jgi:hypothetical protein
MNAQLSALLDHLARTLDPGRQGVVEALHRQALSWQPVARLPVVMAYPLPPDAAFEPFPHREIFNDPAKMLFNELTHAFQTSIACRDRLNDDLPCTVRANFGTVLIASMFGARVEQFDDNPPWVMPPDGDGPSLEAVVETDPGDFSRGWCPRVIETYAFYRETLGRWPTLRRLIKVVLPDLQSPFDNLELIVGSSVFEALRVRPELVGRALARVAQAQVGFARRLAEFVTDGPEGFAHQHATMIRGRILLRDDSVILMSPAMYRDVVAPHDEFVLRELGGGGIHCCGNVERHAPAFLERAGLECFDFGQSEMNDVDAIYRLAQARRAALIRVAVSEAELSSGEILRRFPTGVSLIHRAGSFDAARRAMENYLRATRT